MAAVVLVAAVTGCGSGTSPDGTGAAGTASNGGPAGAATRTGQPSGAGAGPADEKLAADPGVRYKVIAVPELEGLVCDEGDGGFHYGSDLDMSVTGDDALEEVEGDSQDLADEVSCFGSRRNVLSKGRISAAAPMFTARTHLYENVPDPAAALNAIFDASVDQATGYGRNFTGKPRTATSATLVVKCRQNVTDTFPMTTCFWANYGAAGVVDFFPADGQYLPIDSAVPWTRDFVAGALRK
ncbi:hypothetical protein ASE09_32205 [Streptomyces sp. Root66D1]|nr:hypothetical protein ASD33_32420 [Streptomyces sp. Root1304]KRA93534.1 hypothetical protein ASE09_32205 [Streptomyces sp. Root66D1]